MYEKYIVSIEDVALDVSQTDYWRKKIFASDYDQRILISKFNIDEIPDYIKPIFIEEGLTFLVSKVKESPESDSFDEGSIIFKFEAVPFPDIVRYTGN
ncbi:hypothetical protein [Enterococcus sp. LJL51]|uniref:hypothetical protein n=1 Tax=Enterococcus sp. LJL51 TaxID=3416656 RepID=UPI003CF12CE8